MRVSYQFIAKPSAAAVTIGRYRHAIAGQRTFYTAGINLVRAHTGGVRFVCGEHTWTLGRGECLLLPHEVALQECVDFAPAELVYYFISEETVRDIVSGLPGPQTPLERGLKFAIPVALNAMLQDLAEQASAGGNPEFCDDIVASLIETLVDPESGQRPLLTPEAYAELAQKKDGQVVALVKASRARSLLEKRVPVQKLTQILEIDGDSLARNFKMIWRRDLNAFAESLSHASDQGHRSASQKWKKRVD